ncbi:SpoIIE family protein phosphatase [Roseovarius sp. SCSIO 43702]|uniref:PP2C family protein-serine/threonine phosphatase n=1 Tax=Roseovarius sp. SCSIO 43702 TaxID=2823043 RepID=UPI001C735954|nr:SpoIIE family protein phosphatase [Roseovarius sp. SCSIO 43702]QYX57012.1 SpoIIE family protein phosphatase [Roseovarius sp. SCSIO 43702]
MTPLIDPFETSPGTGAAIRDVLIVDDSRLQRRLLASLLGQWGFAVREADSGAAALELCAERPPDLVLSDWMMPGMDGLDFCRAFRELAQEDYGYFILLTSKGEKEEIARGLDAGADDFLTKPVNADELRARIEAGERILRMGRELSQKNRVIRATLDELQTLYDSIDRDLVEAQKLQQSLVSERHKDFGAGEASLFLRSSGRVGGDLVGVFEASPTRVGLYSIDVSGHGISSALMTARLAGYLSASAPDQNVALERDGKGGYVMRAPSETVAMLNALFLDELETEHYFTMALADVDLASGRVQIAQAGHPHPIVQRRSGACEIVGGGGLPVGLIEAADFQQFEVTLGPGDRLMIHSDGIVECAGPDGRLLGDDGLAHILSALKQTRALACLESIAWKMTEFAGTDRFHDDVSAVMFEFKDWCMVV